MEVDFENVGAVLGKGEDGVVAQLNAFVEFELRKSKLADAALQNTALGSRRRAWPNQAKVLTLLMYLQF